MSKIIVLCTFVCLVAAQKATFNNYKVLRIIPTTTQVNKLRQLEAILDGVDSFKYKYKHEKKNIEFNLKKISVQIIFM